MEVLNVVAHLLQVTLSRLVWKECPQRGHATRFAMTSSSSALLDHDGIPLDGDVNTVVSPNDHVDNTVPSGILDLSQEMPFGVFLGSVLVDPDHADLPDDLVAKNG